MKKVYNAPALECLEFFSAYPFGNGTGDDVSFPWNDGDLGWGEANWT